MPAQVNAALLRVTTATAATGGRDDWDAAVAGTDASSSEPAGAGVLKWSGEADAYLRETVRRDAGETGGVVEARILYVDSAVARAAGIDTDDVLTFRDVTGAERTARARIVARAELAGIPARLATTRLELEEQ